MLGNNGRTNQLSIWVITAMLGPILYFSQGNWLDTLVVSLVLSAATGCAVRYGKHWNGPIYNIVQLIWLALILAHFLGYSSACWPTGDRTFPVIPFTLLILAAASSIKGYDATANGMSIVFWMGLFLIGIVFVAGFWNIEPRNLYPKTQNIDAQTMLVFMLPGAVGLIKGKKFRLKASAAIIVLAVAITAWIAGILSPVIALQVTWPFYEAAKTVELFDVAKRFEALVSVGVTLCNYALYSLLLCAAASIGERFGRRRESVVICVGISASLILLGASIKPDILLVLSIIFWVILPLFGILSKNKNE